MAILKCLATGDFHPIDASDGAHMHQPKRGEHYVIMFALSSKGGFWRITESRGHDEAAATASDRDRAAQICLQRRATRDKRAAMKTLFALIIGACLAAAVTAQATPQEGTGAFDTFVKASKIDNTLTNPTASALATANGFVVSTGSNQLHSVWQRSVTLAGGTTTYVVADTAVSGSTIIVPALSGTGANPATVPRVTAIVSGTSFTLTTGTSTDTGTIRVLLFRP